MTAHKRLGGLGVAVIGMAGRFPGARSVAELWDNVCRGVESISFFSDEELLGAGVSPELLKDPRYVKAYGFLDGFDMFDAAFFGYTPREAELMDPQQRLFLECAWEALENAGYAPNGCHFPVGVFAGQSFPLYFLAHVYPATGPQGFVEAMQLLLVNDKDYLTSRVAYKLNLRGPVVTVQTACSTSLVAAHLACQSLLAGECDMALAGGVTVSSFRREGYLYEEGGVLSADGHCRAFDAGASGTAGGNGVAIVVLKRLADAVADGDTIYAVIRGSAVNNDGSDKVGFTAPSVDAQAAVIREALTVAGVRPDTVGYVEAHGTGTLLGDPVEIAALKQAFGRTARRGYCAVGSVKTNVGHLYAAAGAAGLIEAALALANKTLPPSLHFRRPNPNIDLDGSPFYVITQLAGWKAGRTPRRAGVTSLGIGGTNAHVVLEEAPSGEGSGRSRPWHLLSLSAKTEAALEAATADLARHLERHADLKLADVAYTLHVGRSAFDCRRAVVVRDTRDAVTALSAPRVGLALTGRASAEERPLAFLFPGQGTQYVNMSLGLYQAEPAFRATIDRCSAILAALGLDLRACLYPDQAQMDEAERRLSRTDVAQPALFAVEYALASMLMEWGVRPTAMLGHSIGEYVAACLAGVFSLEDALALVAARGRLIQAAPGGAMLAVHLPAGEVVGRIGPDLSLAAVNAPSVCTVAGPVAAVQALAEHLAAQGVECRRLHTSHAFHSWMMDPLLEPLAREVEKVKLNAPRLPYLSNVTGTWITREEARDPTYWARHLRQTVRFCEGVQELQAEPDTVFIEVGPGRALTTLVRPGTRDPRVAAVSTLPHPRSGDPEVAFLLGALGRLWLLGVAVDWGRFYGGERRRRVPLPTYPFQRQRFWVEAPAPVTGAPPAAGTPRQVAAETAGTDAGAVAGADAGSPPAGRARPDLPTPYAPPQTGLQRAITAVWEEVLGFRGVGIHDDLFELGGYSLVAAQVVVRLREVLSLDIPLRSVFEGPTIARLAEVAEALFIQKLEQSPPGAWRHEDGP